MSVVTRTAQQPLQQRWPMPLLTPWMIWGNYCPEVDKFTIKTQVMECCYSWCIM